MGLPLLVDFGTEQCHWCKKLDTDTFRDPSVAALVSERPLKIDGEKQATLVEKLGIQSYPTLVFAAPDGKILETKEGYVDAATFCKYFGRVLMTVEASKDPSGGPTRVKVLNARELLDRIHEDDRNGQDVWCLLRCKFLADAFPDSPEAAEAQRLVERIRNDPLRARQARKELADVLARLPREPHD